MPTLQEIEKAMIAADKMGNAADAKILAKELQRAMGTSPASAESAAPTQAPAPASAQEVKPVSGIPYFRDRAYDREPLINPGTAGVVKGLIINPIEAVANLGVAGLRKAGLITQAQADEFQKTNLHLTYGLRKPRSQVN